MIEPAELPKLLTLEDTARILGRHKRTVAKLAADGKIGCVRIGERGVRFTPEDVQDFIDAHRSVAR